jgi:uncharacterized repeat protein (TIGR03803 family)
LATDGSGNLHGTTFAGGSGCGHQQGCGTVFKIDKQGKFKVLHRFAGENKDGAGPHDAVELQGGIGFTWEHECHIYLKRAWLNRLIFGSEDAYLDRAAILLSETA